MRCGSSREMPAGCLFSLPSRLRDIFLNDRYNSVAYPL
jgi:hypothetical protein